MTQFDIFAGLIILVSALIGFMRGATREVITAVSFIAAVALSVLLLRYTGPITRHIVHTGWAAVALALVIVFLIAYIALRLLGGRLAKGIQETQGLGTIDRTLGVGIGLVRALVVLGVFSLVYTTATPQARRPQWIEHSALYPLSAESGKVLMAFAPKTEAATARIGPAIEKAVRDGTEATTKGKGYSDTQLKSVDDLVEKVR
ncbi:MAG: CvpA family protein [Ignavibacteriales bacterium]